MRKILKYIYTYAIPVILILSLFTLSGCKEELLPTDITNFYKDSEAATKAKVQTTVKNTDITKRVEIIGYLIGDRPKGMNDVLQKLNEKLKKDINTTMKINYIEWGDLQSKYALVLASGEDLDFIFTGNWAYYGQEAAKGAFLEIKQDMVKRYILLQSLQLGKRA